MRLSRRILLLLMASAAVLSCRREQWLPVEEEMVDLGIYVRFPEAATKAEVAGTAAESTIYDLRIWVFLSEGFDDARPAGYLLGYISPYQNNAHRLTAYEDRYFLRIPADIAHAKPDLDVYVLANGPNINRGGFNANTTRATLDAALLEGNYYGVSSDGRPLQTTVPSNGLPFSAVGKHLPMRGNYPTLSVQTVTAKRLVSKFRFVVSQLTDLAGPVLDFSIDELSLDGGMIGAKEYIFNTTGNDFSLFKSGTDAVDYLQPRILYPIPGSVALNPSPQDYAFVSGAETYDEYQTRIQAGIEAGHLTDAGVAYFRETDKPLSGRVVYTINGEQRTHSFSMSAPGGFSRGHSWLAYLYFTRDKIHFTVSWTDWEQGGDFNLGE